MSRNSKMWAAFSKNAYETLSYNVPGEPKKMYLSLVKHTIKTILSIFKILLFLNQDFSYLNFGILPFIFRFNLAELCNF